MRLLALGCLVACRTGVGNVANDGETTAGTDTGTEYTLPTTVSTSETTVPAEPCDPVAGLVVDDVEITQPWSEHEARLSITMSDAASVAVACTLEGDPTEVHLVEGGSVTTQHSLRLAGLLASSTYQCRIAPTCPSSTESPTDVVLETGRLVDPNLPTLDLTVHEAGAGTDYIATNHQRNDTWNGMRRFVMDREARIRWQAQGDVGNAGGSQALGWSTTSGRFTIGGTWPPNELGRAQQISLYGSVPVFDTLPVIPDASTREFHHEARELSDGQLLTLDEPVVVGEGGQSFRGFGATIVDPATGVLTFDYSCQDDVDDGNLPSGTGDAYHSNWANVYDVDGDEVLHVSLCATSWVVGIDLPSGDWRWAFGRDGDFALVDPTGKPLPDDEFPMCQHGLQRRGNRLLVYDNGQQRNVHQRGYSRVVEYELDESTMTATKIWDWTEPEWWENNLGGVDYTTAGVLVAMGHLESSTRTEGDVTTFVEVDPATDEKLWEVRYGLPVDMAYRAEAIPPCDLFANAKYCSEVVERLTTLQPVLEP